MAKPRIIIADEDYSYIIPLQIKLSEEFSDKIDIELITERDYLEEFLSTPQEAEALVIDEALFNSSIQRHNIGNVFVMAEQPDEDTDDSFNVSRLFKYTSIKEIYNEIIGKSGISVSGTKEKRTQIITVCSATGGAGKTTLALGISASLARGYKKVLYINAATLQSFQRILNNSSPISSPEIYSLLASPTADVFNSLQHVLRKESFTYLPPFRAALISLGLSFDVFAKIAESAKRTNLYDFIIVDLNCGFEENLALMLHKSDRVIVVTNPTATSRYATNVFVSNINGISNEKYTFICNNCCEEDESKLESSSRYVINQYIKHFDNYDSMSCDDLARDSGMQKTAFLIV